ncbi:MAG TPA: SLC13 family permease [Vicinamibacterales bacterium]|nr:SLC13 family permease [Vicinamibacterales bacterium]
MLLTITPPTPAIVTLPGRQFVLGSLVVACAVLMVGQVVPLPAWLLAAEVFATILGLFLFGSFRYQVHKDPFTYGMALVIVATFCGLPTSEWHLEVAADGWLAWTRLHLLSYRGLDAIVHADTMLFILGLTFFVSTIAQTRMLEGITLALLRRNGGRILPTIVAVTAVVALASGVLDGVSMIGLTIRTLVIILMLAAAPRRVIVFAIMICTTVTTVCGVWLAYGEPPNLIMKANLHPLLGGTFFLRYCAPIAIAAFIVVVRHLSKQLAGMRIDVTTMDVVDLKAADVRFLQARRHGEVLTPAELVEAHRTVLGSHAPGVLDRLRRGASLGSAMVGEDVPSVIRQELLGHFAGEDLAHSLDRHYVLQAEGDDEGAMLAEQWIDDTLRDTARERRRAQTIGARALIPFTALLIAHGINHHIPLFLASFAGFGVALLGIARHPRMRALALRDAWREYAEYYFLFPLFLSITLLTQARFFDGLAELLREGLTWFGAFPVAWVQFAASTLLSAILDNNVVADFASRALDGLDVSILHLFAMAQIAGYALGGCWTHIGCAQSVVAYAFIQSEVEQHYSPMQWIREMTPVILEMLAIISVLIYAETLILGSLG